MSAAKVVYEVQVPGASSGSVEPISGAFVLPSGASSVTLRELKASWPFEGSFRFRAKLVVPENEGGFLWLDLLDEDETAPLENGVATIRALPLFPVASTVGAVLLESEASENDFNLTPQQYDQWRTSRVELMRMPLPERSPRGSPTAAPKPRSDSSVQGSPESPHGGNSSRTPFGNTPNASPPSAANTAAAKGADEWGSSGDDNWGSSQRGGGAAAGSSPQQSANEWGEEEDFPQESSAAAWEREHANASSSSSSAGASVLKGFVSKMKEAAVDVKKAADKAAKNVEKKGWFKGLKEAAGKAAAAVSAGLADDPMSGGGSGERRERRGTNAYGGQGQALEEEEDEGAGGGAYESEPPVSRSQKAATSGKAAADAGAGEIDGLDWRTD